eukprot:2297489-Rhodomonas_salina.1
MMPRVSSVVLFAALMSLGVASVRAQASAPTLTCTRPRTDRIANLIGYWPLSSSFRDASGNGYDLWAPDHKDRKSGYPDLVPSNTSYGEPFNDGYANFDPKQDENSERVELLWSRTFNPGNGGSFSIEFWFKVVPGNNKADIMVSFIDGATKRFNIKATGSCQAGDVNNKVTASGLCPDDGMWRHMAFTVDSSLNQAKMYINGVEQGSSDSFDTHLCANNDCTGGTFTIGAS